ncbi:MAG: exodeoxyribonuclease VII small subunit [Peptococcaceae bacterium]|nr:exodeoxyribonuclease VII small subunit [Peptococcaceae bacterium]
MPEPVRLSYEEAVKNLEKVIRALEVGEVPLEQALELFQEGIQLVKICSGKLEEAEKRIQILMEDANGTPSLQPAPMLEEGIS